METRWHYRVHGRDIGPVDFATLQTMASEERLFVDDEVRPADSDEWVRAESIEGLFTEAADEDDLSSMLAPSDSASGEAAIRDAWYCRTRNDELGPMPFGKVVNLARHGRLARRDQIRHGAHGNWVEARSIDGLFEDAVPSESAVTPAQTAGDSLLDGFEIVSDPTPGKPKTPRPTLEPILRMDDDVSPVNAAAERDIPDTEALWTCRVLGQAIGPIPWSDMVELVETRQLGPNDRVRKGNSVAWVPAGTVDNLIPKRKKNKGAKKKKLSDAEVASYLRAERPENDEVSSHVAPQRNFSRAAAETSDLRPPMSSPMGPASRPLTENPVAASPSPPAPRPDMSAAIAAASAGSRPPVPRREKRSMGNPFAGLGDSLANFGDRLAESWKPIAAVVAVVLIGAGIYSGRSLFSSSSKKEANYYSTTLALWHEAEALRTSSNQKQWEEFGKRYESRIHLTTERLMGGDDDLAAVLLQCYRDYLPEMIGAPIDGADEAWQKMEQAMATAESLN